MWKCIYLQNMMAYLNHKFIICSILNIQDDRRWIKVLPCAHNSDYTCIIRVYLYALLSLVCVCICFHHVIVALVLDLHVAKKRLLRRRWNDGKTMSTYANNTSGKKYSSHCPDGWITHVLRCTIRLKCGNTWVGFVKFPSTMSLVRFVCTHTRHWKKKAGNVTGHKKRTSEIIAIIRLYVV